MKTTIQCPICQNTIEIEVYALLQGQKFTCTKCSADIGLAANSFSTVENAVHKFEDLKSKSGRM